MNDPALIVTDGGLAGLLACYTEGVCRAGAVVASSHGVGHGVGNDQDSAGKSAVWVVMPKGATDERPWRVNFAKHGAEVCHLGEITEWGGEGAIAGKPAGPAITAMLLAAGAEALKRGLSRVVWPVQLGGTGDERDHDAALTAIADATDRASAAARLLSIDGGENGLVIQTPYVDFTDTQLADLAADVDLPLNACWLGRPGGAERLRWEKALLAVGVEPPDVGGSGDGQAVTAGAGVKGGRVRI